MDKQFDITKFSANATISKQYEAQLGRLKTANKQVDCIEDAVRGALENLQKEDCTSFVIYGEPQSGKTEMMICLTAKLLDEGYNFIVHLLNDSVDLLGQNLGRFKKSGLAPAARNVSEILDPAVDLKTGKHVIFCKKNGKDLRKLIEKIGVVKDIIIVDDEADYASPNAKINKGEKTVINELIEIVRGKSGIYIGVTATPARLNLNNTFENDSHLWVNFPPHQAYTGQDVFFPIDKKIEYGLELLPDAGDNPKYPRNALFSFLVNAAYLNKYVNKSEENYSFLIHTSGKKIDHKGDWGTINATLNELMNSSSKNFEIFVKQIWTLASERYPDADTDDLTSYVIQNISRNSLIVLNSETDFTQKGASATTPTSLFTIIIGGNIVSRGVTLDNLLSMFFTRDVKHKMQQDTYIQRARMFGSRSSYLKFFELTMPNSLYLDWHRCFVFHRLALEAIRQKMGSLVWLSDSRISAVASSSINDSTVDMQRGEMSFQLFNYNDEIDSVIASDLGVFEKMEALGKLLGPGAFPEYLAKYVVQVLPKKAASIAIHPTSSIAGRKEDTNQELIERDKGLMGKSELQKSTYPDAIHHFKIFKNAANAARLFYKYEGSIQFIKNLKNGS
ncbi:Z1 domain-containing protein [Asticcacaulis sp. 201]|uniref:Z1 domain-containing protein n=1 Tax=Asticcacaulis sp. 201 TaxID=3028787 RepID=UPI002916AAE6|nr:Z1 domain-containing protein [Asticcacaulis sp. 201]MDV6330020.1 Z1 domain-containing protein [Asticcacaulis sp. 201]